MRFTSVRRARLLLSPLAVAAGAAPVLAQDSGAWSPREVLATERYVRPPAAVERLVTAPRQENAVLTAQALSPDRRTFYVLHAGGLGSLEDFARPHYYLGGLQVDFRANRLRQLTTRGGSALALVDARTGRPREVALPKGATASSPVWSPDGTRLAFIVNTDDASHLWVADAASGAARRVSGTPLLATLVTEPAWTADGRGIVAVFVPAGRAAEPRRPAVATGPLVRLSDGKKDRTRTYASLLRDPYEASLLEYYATGQLGVADAGSGSLRRVGAPAMILAVDPSPDGRLLRVTLMRKPFSYIVQYTSFGQAEQLWDADGKVLATLGTRPVRLNDFADEPGAGTAGGRAANDTAPRSFGWLPNGKGLYFLQQDPAPANGGRGAVGAGSGAPLPTPADSGVAQAPAATGGRGAARRRDHLYQWTAPWTAAARQELLASDERIASVLLSDDASMALVAENANGTGSVYAAYLAEPGKRYPLWRLRGITATVGAPARPAFAPRGGSGDDSVTFYQNPGEPLVKRGRLGEPVVQLSPDGGAVFLAGTRYSRAWQDSAPRGFLDRVEIRTGKTTRLFEGAADRYETVVTALDDSAGRIVETRESPTTVPDSWVRDRATGQLTRLTTNRDLTPEFTHLTRKRVAVTRADGTRFWVNVTLPADWHAGQRLPALLWFYPYEYTDQAGYDRALRTTNVNQFPAAAPRTIEYMVTQGYAVANFDPPVIGAAGRMNDNYVSDLQSNLYGVIDELERQGMIDRTRLAIGGHSYGAFSTVNAMVHTPFFRAGIAGDGMYNRSLTPTGFQSERRDFWEAQKTYLDMSPFLEADKLTGALLMYHSLEDQNTGTDPISSIRMMHALQALGKTAALYMYPYEDHGPLVRETVLDQWARWVAWLDTYVKPAGANRTPPAPAATTAATTAATAAAAP